MDPDYTPEGTAAVINTAQQAVALQPFDPEQTYAVVSANGSASLLDLEKFRDTPDRPRGVFYPATVESLVNYVKTHQADGATTLWVHEDSGKVVAVLDDHSQKAPAWRQHRAELTLRPSSEWLFWTKLDNQLMPQEAFANHLQEGLPDILNPDGATLLEIAEKFHANTEVKFRSGVDRTSGEVKFLYDESIEAKATTAAGDIAVPRKFTLMLAPFIGEEKVEVEANLRYSAKGGTLHLGYKLERPERIVEAALDRTAEALAKSFDRVYRGTPAA
jgi:uncharacterized protein YfdQ (DUF2303 family)